jgi:Na+/H+-translocating membrane pyrophosphatase
MDQALATSPKGAPAREERSVGDLFGALAAETGTLVRQEVQLATRELSQKARYAAQQGATIAVGAALGMVSLMALVAGTILVLGKVIPLWGAALAVGGSLGIVACLVARSGYQALARMDRRPEQTLLSIKETKSWVQEQVR